MVTSLRIWKLSGVKESNPEPLVFDVEVNSLDQATRLLPDGAYTTFRTFGKSHILRFGDHLQRLEETARLAGVPLELDRLAVTSGLRAALEDFSAEEARVRMSIDLTVDPGMLYLMLEPLHAPQEKDYLTGVRVVTRRMQRENPKAKLTAFIATADEIRHALPEGINEAVMIGADGRALEGLSSNFFGVKDGVIWTAEEGVLSGITRTLALEVIRARGLPLRLEGVRAEELASLDEAFITSASRAVLPVVEIDGQRLGSGQPGPVTQVVLAGYRERIESELESLQPA